MGIKAYRKSGGLRALGRLPGRNQEHRRRDRGPSKSRAFAAWAGRDSRRGRKWRIVSGYPGPRLMALNADEGEPGTFKDRVVMETDPHRVIEGMLIAAWAVEAEDVYLYLRDEYPGLHRMLTNELEHVAGAGLSRATRIHLRRGAPAPTSAAEESAMVESIEGKARPAPQPPPLPGREGPVRPPDPDQQPGNRVLCPRHPAEGAGLVFGRRAQGMPGNALLFRLRPGQGTRRQAGPGGGHRNGADRGVLGRHGRRPNIQRLRAGRRVRRHPARVEGRHPA